MAKNKRKVRTYKKSKKSFKKGVKQMNSNLETLKKCMDSQL